MSSAEGKDWTWDRVQALAEDGGPVSVLDIGPGVGTYAKLLAGGQRAIYLSIPIVRYPQGQLEGNPHEHHVVDDWDREKVLAASPGSPTSGGAPRSGSTNGGSTGRSA